MKHLHEHKATGRHSLGTGEAHALPSPEAGRVLTWGDFEGHA